MKTFRLLVVALLVACTASTVSAQRMGNKSLKGDYSPTVYLISTHEVDSIYNCCSVQQAAMLNRVAIANTTQDYLETHRRGVQQAEKPQFVFGSKNNRFSFSVGGFVALRAAYEFDGIVNNLDFIPYNIPVPGNYATRQKLMMDATTSRLFLKAIANTRALGRVLMYVDIDFRGGAPGSYMPRLRTAYVSFKGLTLGRDVTTFCDLESGPTTIDFQGPNAFNFNYAVMIRYEVSFARKHMTFGVAAEMPNASATYNNNFAPIPQRMPDFPLYLQYAWGENNSSHIRASGVLRNLYYHNLLTDENASLFGWGAQFSGTIGVTKWVRLFMNGVYGQGITPYLQDLTGSGFDFAPDPSDPAKLQTMPMWGWQAAAQFNLSRRLFVSAGYSMVQMEQKNGFIANDQYRKGRYLFGNVFYNITPRCQVAGEYLYGTRQNMIGDQNHANCVNLMLKYSF